MFLIQKKHGSFVNIKKTLFPIRVLFLLSHFRRNEILLLEKSTSNTNEEPKKWISKPFKKFLRFY